MGKITNLIIGLVIIGFIFTGFMLFVSDSVIQAGEVTFTKDSYKDNSTYNKIQEINELNQQIKDQGETEVEQSTADILGSYFKQGYSAFRITLSSGSLATEMVSGASQDIDLAGDQTYFWTMLTTIIMIIVIFGIIIYTVIGREV